MTDTIQAARKQVLAFRLAGHNLVERQPLDRLADVAGACGIRNTPPGSALLALNARLHDLRLDAFEAALDEARELVEVLAMRISPHLVPTRDVAIFTLGALPADEKSARGVLATSASNLDRHGISALDAIQLTTEAARAELADGPLSRSALSAGLTRALPEGLSQFCKPCGSTHVYESLFRLAGVGGAFVISRDGRNSVYVRTDRWLGAAPNGEPEHPAPANEPPVDASGPRGQLLRRYLRCFGPSSAADFAAWVGITTAEAELTWKQMAAQLVPVDLDGRRSWLHADDLPSFNAPPEPSSIRLLPPYDAYLDQRDRAALLPDKALHRRVWAALGNPGVVLLDGEIAGIWRAQKKGKRLAVAVEPFGPLRPQARAEIEAEAGLLGPLRACTTVEVSFSA